MVSASIIEKYDNMNNLQKRLFDFGVNVLLYLRKVPKNRETMVIKDQLSRSVTSPGAVYEEAQGAVSRPDFHNKINCCLKEIRESGYWLRMLKALHCQDDELIGLIAESEELRKIFTTISTKTQNIKASK
jgi:four helix bundle protein